MQKTIVGIIGSLGASVRSLLTWDDRRHSIPVQSVTTTASASKVGFTCPKLRGLLIQYVKLDLISNLQRTRLSHSGSELIRFIMARADLMYTGSAIQL